MESLYLQSVHQNHNVCDINVIVKLNKEYFEGVITTK